MAKQLVRHIGGCHCGSVRFEVWAPSDLHVYDCKYDEIIFCIAKFTVRLVYRLLISSWPKFLTHRPVAV